MFAQEEKKEYLPHSVDQDGLWKKIILELFQDFIQFFMPDFYKHIDFSQPVTFLDKELFQDILDQKKGRKYADQIAKVRLKNGDDQWVLIHIEIQSSKEDAFSKRMFQYFYRIFDRHTDKIVALALHTSPGNLDHMTTFEYKSFGTSVNYSYNNYMIQNYSVEALEGSSNIFSKVVLAAQKMHTTKGNLEERYQFKLKLLQELMDGQKYDETTIIAAVHFVDYLLHLPTDLTKKLAHEVSPIIQKERGLMERYNEENTPPTVSYSFAEQLDRGIASGREKGREEGREEGELLTLIEMTKSLLEKKFGEMPEELQTAVEGADRELLSKFLPEIFTVETLDEVWEFFQ